MRLEGKSRGEYGTNGGDRGDLVITTHVAEHPLFKRDSADFIAGLAALGQSVPEQYAVAALLELEPQAELTPEEACAWAQAQVVSLLKSSEGKLRGKLRKLAERNDAAFLETLAQEPDPDDPDKPPLGGAPVPTADDDADVSADAADWVEAEATDEWYDSAESLDDVPADDEWYDAEAGEDDLPVADEATAEWYDAEPGEDDIPEDAEVERPLL